MPIYGEQRIYQDAWHGSGDPGQVDFLLALIGEVLSIYIDYRIEVIAIASEDNPIFFAPAPSVIGSLQNENVIYDPNGIAFQDFHVGDQIHVETANNLGNYTITEKIDDGFIRCGSNFNTETAQEDDFVVLITKFSGLKYFWNFIENDDPMNFNSAIDNEVQMLKTNAADAENVVPVVMEFNGIKSYQIGGGLLTGQGIDEYSQRFRLIHQTTLTPLFLASQFADLLARIAPEYYLDSKCLRHVYRLECSRTLNDPNPALTLEVDDVLGNSGWFNENYNGGQSKFSASNITIKRVSDNQTIEGIQIDVVSEYNLRVIAANGASFTNAQTRVVVNFMYLPETAAAYQNNGKNLTQNFVLDRASFKLGAATVPGQNNATPLQVITEAQAILISPTEISVRIRFDLGSETEATMTQGDFRRYAIFVTTETYGVDRNTSDKAALLIDVNELFEDLPDIDIVNTATKFLIHTDSDPITEGVDYVNAFPTDDIVASTDFSIDYVGGEPILINKIEAGIVLKKPGQLDITLEKFSFDTSAVPLEGGLVPLIEVDQNRVFKIPTGEIRLPITIDRRPDLDAGNLKYWTINFPFMHRWEYWKALGIIDNIPAGILDPAEPLNGLNQEWHRYTTVPGWNIYHRLKFIIGFDGQEFEQIVDVSYTSMDFNSNPEWINESIKSYTEDDIELLNGSEKLLQGYANTKIVASFEKTTGDLPDVADVHVVFWIGRKDMDGIENVRRASSKYELDPDSWFKSIDSSNKVVVENPSAGVYTGTILVDPTKIPQSPDFRIYARIYDPVPLTPEDAKITEDGDLKYTEEGELKIVESEP